MRVLAVFQDSYNLRIVLFLKMKCCVTAVNDVDELFFFFFFSILFKFKSLSFEHLSAGQCTHIRRFSFQS